MNAVLKVFLSMSLSGSLLILLLRIGKSFFKDKLSKQWQYYIWLLVVARLLLPFAPEANLMTHVFQAIDSALTQSESIAAAQKTSWVEKEIPFTEDPSVNSPFLADTKRGDSPGAVQDIILLLKESLWVIWGTGVLLMLVRKVTIYQGFVRYIKAGLRPVADTALLDRLAALAEQAGVKKPVELCVNSLVASPLLLGILHPCIILPSTELSEAQFQYTILHELIHYRRWDLFVKWLVQVTICLHWFNPLVYLMGREINIGCELSCDEAIIRNLDGESRRAYGHTLLSAMGAAGQYRQSVASVTLRENKELLKERLDAIMGFQKKSKGVISLTLAVTLCLCAAATTIGAYNLPKDTEGKKDSASHLTREESLAENMEPYRAFGLIYDKKQDIVFYNGEPVKVFADIREVFPSGGYSFHTGYFDWDADSELYLAAAHDKQGKVIGIEKMPDDIKADLSSDFTQAKSSSNVLEPLEPLEALEALEPLESLRFPESVSKNLYPYYTYNATTYLNNSTVKVTDCFDKEPIPEGILDWVASVWREGLDAAGTGDATADGLLDQWIFYASGAPCAWQAEIDGDTLVLKLYDFDEKNPSRDYTLIHYTVPKEIRQLQLYDGDEKVVEFGLLPKTK